MTPRQRIAYAIALLATSQAFATPKDFQTALYTRLYRRLERAQKLLGGTRAESTRAMALLPDAWLTGGVPLARLAWWFGVRALDSTCVRLRCIRNSIRSITTSSKALCASLLTGEPASLADSRQLRLAKTWVPMVTLAQARRSTLPADAQGTLAHV